MIASSLRLGTTLGPVRLFNYEAQPVAYVLRSLVLCHLLDFTQNI